MSRGDRRAGIGQSHEPSSRKSKLRGDECAGRIVAAEDFREIYFTRVADSCSVRKLDASTEDAVRADRRTGSHYDASSEPAPGSDFSLGSNRDSGTDNAASSDTDATADDGSRADQRVLREVRSGIQNRGRVHE